jgi:hypothetical protein
LGWIGVFFPYLRDKTGLPVERNPWLPGVSGLEGLLDPVEGARRSSADEALGRRFLHEGHLPSGLATVPFAWKERDLHGRVLRERGRQFLAGFVGVAQDPSSLSLRPEIGWALRQTSFGEGGPEL